MAPEQIVALMRHTLETTLWMAAPLLIIATIVSVIISIVQVITAVQDTTVSTVPRLAAVAVAAFLLTPWMFRKLLAFTTQLLSDFHPFVR